MQHYCGKRSEKDNSQSHLVFILAGHMLSFDLTASLRLCTLTVVCSGTSSWRWEGDQSFVGFTSFIHVLLFYCNDTLQTSHHVQSLAPPSRFQMPWGRNPLRADSMTLSESRCGCLCGRNSKTVNVEFRHLEPLWQLVGGTLEG